MWYKYTNTILGTASRKMLLNLRKNTVHGRAGPACTDPVQISPAAHRLCTLRIRFVFFHVIQNRLQFGQEKAAFFLASLAHCSADEKENAVFYPQNLCLMFGEKSKGS